ncbi:MAG: heparinase II/III family protein, partial [Tepidisphaeraceae bacterium]
MFIQPLEPRLFLSIGPLPQLTVNPVAAAIHLPPHPVTFATSPGSVLTKANRQTLLNGLTLASSLKSSLQFKLNSDNLTGFDQQLLDYFKNRSTPDFYFATGDVAANASYITSHMGDGGAGSRADAVLAHKFPQQSSSETFTVQLPSTINWTSTAPSSNPEFVHALNRHGYWYDLATAYRYTGNAAYANELIDQLASWSATFTSVTAPVPWSTSDQRGWVLDTGIRVESWCWAYYLLLGSGAWSKEANSLFLYKLFQQADFLSTATSYGNTDNRTISHAKGWFFIAGLFPEFTSAAAWETASRQLLFDATDGQFYNDGSHREQSPGYTQGIVEDLLEAKLLDQLNGFVWPSDRNTKLNSAINTYYQFISPDGNRPAIGDTYRTFALSMFLKANLVQGVSTWPAVKPRAKDVWLFGPTTVDPFNSNSNNPPLGNRGSTFALKDSG